MANGILGDIVAAKRTELAARFDGRSLDAMRARAVPTARSLEQAIAKPGARFILEIKRASPSLGSIRAAADPAEIARGYAGVADALSALTDQRYFGGSVSDLALARAEFDGPVLAKDFFIDPRQVVEARLAGADAVLVMLSVLDDSAARLLIEEARRFGMDALVEVHDEAEMQRALALGAPLIGINNRDLRDLSIDLATTERLAPLARDRLLLSESGIAGRSDIARLAPCVDGFLVGSALMLADDPADAARALVFGRIKLCGVNCPDDVAAAVAASHIGLVFVAASPRAIGLAEARTLLGSAAKPVGVFRDAPLSTIVEAVSSLDLAAVQLHGNESADDLRQLRRAIPERCEIWAAVSVGSEPLERPGADRLLFDNGSGGSGRTFDWSLVRDHPELPRALIAGGIGPDNAREAARLGAYALDVGSAVDARPGVKSAEKIRALFETLRQPARHEVRQCA
ncbi:bifunctional indole-3-glycerol-phosphate synthase TrpC/phosphoribosylanthranilate isomerase TrpF [Sphingomonas sp.]|uniref:bifunctional indole-3-glycerol-phosphate synthase TrpC/phosphoribosylanthranilate isomerase TrpF n=1 Tax=Sphingomonas sp. TaxID=28214 RepID=UPI00286BBF73|nr:bifunctional indole-3-glycerol-phosphate synthase TrpC/phosphoribosylanthranilate isomerase TrpF [Sphingomonas sp.]